MFAMKIFKIASVIFLFGSVLLLPLSAMAFPKDNLGKFIFERLDLKSFPSSFGPKLAEMHTLKQFVDAEKGSVEEVSVSDTRIYVRVHDWIYEIVVINKSYSSDGEVKDLEIRFTDKALHGTYNSSKEFAVSEKNFFY